MSSMDRIALTDNWVELRQSAARLDLEVVGPDAVLVHVSDSDTTPAQDAPAFWLAKGTTRVFDRNFTYCRVWARAEKASSSVIALRTMYRGT